MYKSQFQKIVVQGIICKKYIHLNPQKISDNEVVIVSPPNYRAKSFPAGVTMTAP